MGALLSKIAYAHTHKKPNYIPAVGWMGLTKEDLEEIGSSTSILKVDAAPNVQELANADPTFDHYVKTMGTIFKDDPDGLGRGVGEWSDGNYRYKGQQLLSGKFNLFLYIIENGDVVLESDLTRHEQLLIHSVDEKKKVEYLKLEDYEGFVIQGSETYHGFGVSKKTDGSEHYEGHWKLGQRHGFGGMFYKGEGYYIGAWKDNQRSGYGVMTYQNGEVWKGNWKEGMRDGEGILYEAFSQQESDDEHVSEMETRQNRAS